MVAGAQEMTIVDARKKKTQWAKRQRHYSERRATRAIFHLPPGTAEKLLSQQST